MDTQKPRPLPAHGSRPVSVLRSSGCSWLRPFPPLLFIGGRSQGKAGRGHGEWEEPPVQVRYQSDRVRWVPVGRRRFCFRWKPLRSAAGSDQTRIGCKPVWFRDAAAAPMIRWRKRIRKARLDPSRAGFTCSEEMKARLQEMKPPDARFPFHAVTPSLMSLNGGARRTAAWTASRARTDTPPSASEQRTLSSPDPSAVSRCNSRPLRSERRERLLCPQTAGVDLRLLADLLTPSGSWTRSQIHMNISGGFFRTWQLPYEAFKRR